MFGHPDTFQPHYSEFHSFFKGGKATDSANANADPSYCLYYCATCEKGSMCDIYQAKMQKRFTNH